MSVKITYDRSYFPYSICQVNIDGMNKAQLHQLMTLFVKVMGIVQTILYNPPYVTEVIKVCSVLVQGDNPSICFREPGALAA